MRFISILLLLLGLSCQPRSQQEPEPKQYSVPSDVTPFVKAFLAEAQQRGLSVPSDNLIITFGSPQSQDICGQCTLDAGKTPRIVLNDDENCWKGASQQEREALVFHELGHCWLKRPHRTDRFPKGMLVSLMNPSDVSIYATCRYPIGDDDCDKRPRRSYYVDELFDPTTREPVWAR